MARITIAIDGHSSCGKSTLAKHLATWLGYIHIDSGTMYRAVTYAFLQDRVDLNAENEVEAALARLDLVLEANPQPTRLSLGGSVLRDELRSMEVNAAVSDVAKIPMVRRYLVKMQQELAQEGGIVMDGRDIGSVVLPKAELKLFLTARLEVRTERRYRELKDRGLEISRHEVRSNLHARDQIDSNRKDSPLVQTSDAVYIDNSNLSAVEQCAMVLRLAELRAKLA